MNDKKFSIRYIFGNLMDIKYISEIGNTFCRLLFESGIIDTTQYKKGDELSLPYDYNSKSFELNATKGLMVDFINGKNNITSNSIQWLRKFLSDKVSEAIYPYVNGQSNYITELSTAIKNEVIENKVSLNINDVVVKFSEEYSDRYPFFITYINEIDDQFLLITWMIIAACFPQADNLSNNTCGGEHKNTDYFQYIYNCMQRHGLIKGKKSIKINLADDKSAYIAKYSEPFMLHRRGKEISFAKEVYVSPDCEFKVYNDRNDIRPVNVFSSTLIEQLHEQLNKNDCASNVYLILGHGASGKSSFVTMVSANPDILLSENKELAVIMLRRFSDTPTELLTEEIESALPELSNNATIILDGLDELWMMRDDLGMLNAVSIIQFLCSRILSGNRNIIITSRPGVVTSEEVWEKIRLNTNVYGMTIATIKPFNQSKRVEFVEKLINADPSLKEKQECKWVRELSDNDAVNEVYGLPFFIYLIVASSKAPSVAQNPISELERENKWALFRRLFHDIYFDSYYWEGEIHSKSRSEIKQLKEKLYEISGYVAWKMFSEKLGQYYCTAEQIKEIIANLGYKPELLDELSNFFPVSSYINKVGNNHAYEFSHNFVRDFFLCEFVLSQLNSITTKENTNNRIIYWARDFLFPHDLLQTAYGIQQEDAHWVFQFVMDYSDYYRRYHEKDLPYNNLMHYPITEWNKIFYSMYHQMTQGILSNLGAQYNKNVFLNLKYFYLSIFPLHNGFESTVNTTKQEQIQVLRSIKPMDRITYGLSEWYVIEVNKNYITLIAASGFIKQYHDINYNSYSINNINWDNSTLRSWLNHEFFVYFFANFERLAFTHDNSADPVTILKSEEWFNIKPALLSNVVDNTLTLQDELHIPLPHYNSKLRIHTIGGTLKSISYKWDNYKWENSIDFNKYGMVFPVIKILCTDFNIDNQEY